MTKFQRAVQEEEKDYGRTNSAAAEAVQTGEGGQECIGGQVLDLVVDCTQVNQMHYAAVAGREAAEDYQAWIRSATTDQDG